MTSDTKQQQFDAQAHEFHASGQHYASVSGASMAAYFAAIAMGDVNKAWPAGWTWILFFPVLFWFVTLTLSFWQMDPRPANKRWGNVEKARARWLAIRNGSLQVGRISFFLGVAVMVFILGYYLAVLSPATPPPPTP